MNDAEKIIAIAKKILKQSDCDINLTTEIHQLNFDGLDLLEFQMEVDETFGIEVETDNFLECKTISDLTQLISEYKVNK